MRLPAALLTALFLSTSLPVQLSAENETALRVLRFHAEALGGVQTLTSIRSFSYTAEIEISPAGMEGTIKSWSLKPCMFRSEVSMGPLEIIRGFDGKRSWTVNHSGMVSYQDDSVSVKKQKTICYIEEYRYLSVLESPGSGSAWKDIPGQVKRPAGRKSEKVPAESERDYDGEEAPRLKDGFEYIGMDTSYAGSECHVIGFYPAGCYPFRIYIGRDNFLTEELVIESYGGDIVRRYGDYRKAGNLNLPFTMMIHNPYLQQTVTTRISSVRINPPMSPSLFIPERGRRKGTGYSEEEKIARIPFRYVGGHIYLEARLEGTGEGALNDSEKAKLDKSAARGDSPENVADTVKSGKDENFILDSGAGMTVIDSLRAVKLGLPLGNRIAGAGISGARYCYLTQLPAMEIGGLRFTEQTVIASSITDMVRRYTGISVAGILGSDFLNRFVAAIDYQERNMTLFEPDSFEQEEAGAELEAPLAQGILSIVCAVEDSCRGRFLVDTGSNRSILQHSFAEKYDLLEGRKSVKVPVIGAGGETFANLCRFESIKVGENRIDQPLLFVAPPGGGIAAFEDISGVLGNDILDKFHLTLDYPGRRVFLKKNSSFLSSARRDKSGLLLAAAPSGSYYIHYVISGSPAFEAGIRTGDRIISLGGKAIQSFSSIDDITLMLSGREGEDLEIIVERNGERKRFRLILKNYL